MRPRNIILLRHGQSEGNANKSVYKTKPDYALKLTEKGRYQCIEAAHKLTHIVSPETPIQFYVSPFWRTRETFLNISKVFSSSTNMYIEDPRIREQEWGVSQTNTGEFQEYSDKMEEYRDQYGHFYYRFRNGGESCADVFDRVSDFIGTMFRDFEKSHYPSNVIIVTHGMTMRLFLMRWFHCSVEEFETWGNPLNCGYYHMQYQTCSDKYSLLTPVRRHKLRHDFQFDWEETTPRFGAAKLQTYM